MGVGTAILLGLFVLGASVLALRGVGVDQPDRKAPPRDDSEEIFEQQRLQDEALDVQKARREEEEDQRSYSDECAQRFWESG